MPADVFISYAHSTRQSAARRLRDALVKEKFEVFLDERVIPYGNPFPRDIADGLLNSRLAIIFADETYFQRPWCVYEFQVITAPYRAGREVGDKQLEHVSIILPESGDIAAVIAHLPPPLARVSWPTDSKVAEIAEMIRNRLTGLTSTLETRISDVNDDAVERLRAGGDIPLAWAKARPADDAGELKPVRHQCIDLAPETRGEEFIGRGAEIWRLFHHLVTCRAFKSPRACGVQGLGGSGKSQLAAEFVARYGERFFPGGVFWVSADVDAATLVGQFRSILQTLSPGSPDPVAGESKSERQLQLLADALMLHFSSVTSGVTSGGEMLWVVDGIPELSGNNKTIRYWCPVSDYVNVLATSRRTGLNGMDAYVDLGGLTASSAVELLTRPNVDRHWLEDDDWEVIADWVGGLPLAISILRAGLSDGFTTAEALKLARRQEPSVLLDREMDALRGEVEDKRLRGVTEVFEFSYRALEHDAGLLNAAHLIARLAPFPLSESILTDLVPSPLIGRLAKRNWIQPVASGVDGRITRRWIMHRIPASFIRSHKANAQQEFAELFNWLKRVVQAELTTDDIRALEYHLRVIQRGLQTIQPEIGGATQAAREFAVTAVSRYMATLKDETAGLRYLAAGLANETGAGREVVACLETAYQKGSLDTAKAIPHTLQALTGNPEAVSLMGRLIQDPRDQVRYQAIVHATSLRSLDLAIPLLNALLKESTGLEASYDIYLDNGCPVLRDILSELINRLNNGTPHEREHAAKLLGRALIVNGKNLEAGGFTSRHLVSGLLHFALKEESETIRSAALSSASHYFDAEAYNILTSELAGAKTGQQRSRLLAILGEYLSGTRRPPPPNMEIEWLDSGGMRISGQLPKIEPLPPGVYDPLIEAVQSNDRDCAIVAARAILDTNEGKIAAGEAAHQLLDSAAYDHVAAMANALAELAPDFTNAFWWRGQARQALQNAVGAIDDYSIVIRQAPNFADAYLYRGQLLLESKQFDKALPDLLRAGELSPDLFAAHHLVSLCLYNLDRYSEAEAAADRAIAIAPQVGEAWFFRGIARYATGSFAEALHDIKRAVEIDPSDERAVQFKVELESYLDPDN